MQSQRIKNQRQLERDFCSRSRLSSDPAEAWQRHAAQRIAKTYADIGQRARS